MKNIEMNLEGNILTIKVNLEQASVNLSGDEGIIISTKETASPMPDTNQHEDIFAQYLSVVNAYSAANALLGIEQPPEEFNNNVLDSLNIANAAREKVWGRK